MSWLPQGLFGKMVATKSHRVGPKGNREVTNARNELIRADCASGLTTAALCEKYGLSNQSIWRITHRDYIPTSGYPISEEKAERNEAWNAEFLAGKNASKIAAENGISRERVCQILRKKNTISLVAERKRLAREAMAAEATAIKDEARTEFEANLAVGIDLIRQGHSIAEAMRRSGVSCNVLGPACKRAGVATRYGRWRDLGPTLVRAREMRAQGATWAEIFRALPEEGFTPISAQIVSRHLPDLVLRRSPRGVHAKETTHPQRPIKEPKAVPQRLQHPDNSETWTDERVAALINHWFHGCSAMQCADLLGPPITRNAVIWKIGRLRATGKLLPPAASS